MATPCSSLLQLPPETIISIITNLILGDVLRLSETCRLLHNIVKTSTSIQYQIERKVANVVHGESQLSIADCLTLLKKTEHKWATLQFSRVEEASSRPGNLWELFGGVLAFSMRSSSNHIHTYEGLSFIELPSALRGAESKTRSLTNLGYKIRDFGMDPAQDLLVVIEVVHAPVGYFAKLLTMSTGQSHPLASQPILSCNDRPPLIRYSFVIQVMGDFLGVLLHTNLQNNFVILQDQFLLWNWKTGHKVLQLSPCQDNIRYDSFSFISPSHLVIPRLQPIPDTNVLPYLEVYSFSEYTGETLVDPHPYRTFELPELNEDVIIISITTRSDPSPDCLGVTKSSLLTRPFTTSPKSRLLTIRVELISHLVEVEHVMFFIHQESLLSIPSTSSSDTSHSLNMYHWDSWGPRYSRALLLEEHNSVWVCYVHGTRFVRSIGGHPTDPPGHEGHRLQILDFNPLSIKRYGNYGMENIEVVDWETIIPRNKRLFARDIITSLPYRQSTSVQSFPHIDFMIDEDVVIGLRRVPEGLQRDIVLLSV